MKYRYFILVLVIANNSCRTAKITTFGYSKTEAKDTVTTLQQTSTSKLVVLKAGNGKLYYAKNVTDSLETPALSMGDAAPPPTAGIADPVNEKFRDGQSGGVREEAKTTFATGTYKKMTVRNLFNSLPSNDDMEQFGLGNSSPRVVPEMKNVHIRKAYLYIVKHEEDNDYHFIFGDKPDYREATYILNGEISGLAVHFKKDSARLKKVRQDAIDFFKTIKQCGTSNYILSIPVQIKGSLFFDFFHRTNTARCLSVQSKTPWEIHPVYEIKFN